MTVQPMRFIPLEPLVSAPRRAVVALALVTGFAVAAIAQEPAAAPPAPTPPRTAQGDHVVARVNGKEITLRELSQAVNQYVMANRLGPDSGIPVPEIQRTVLDRMIATTLVDQRSAELGLQATPEEIAARLNEMKAQVGDPADFRMMLAVQNLTEEKLRERLAGQIAAEKLMDAEVFAKMEIPDADVRAHFEKHRAELLQPEKARVRQIFVALRRDMSEAERTAAREKIDGIKKRLDGGADFGKLAVELSEDASAPTGGDLGWIRKDEVAGPFQLVAFTTPVGAKSDVVATDYGYLILEVVERQDARPMTLDEARPSITAALKEERIPKAVQDYIAALREKAQVETFLPQS